MKKLVFASTTSLLALGTALVVSSCNQPPVLCTCGRGDFAAVFSYVEGPTECGNLKSEILGMNAYSFEKDGVDTGTMADWGRGTVAIGSERIGWLIDRAGRSMVSDPNAAHKHYTVGDFPKEPTNDFCTVPQMRMPDAEIDVPQLPGVVDDPMTEGDQSEPPVEATHYVYKWSNMEFLVRPDAIGTQLRADLEFTRNSCTAKYKVKAVYPARNCESRTTPGQPDPELCFPVSQPDKRIFEGSGISPDFPVDCVEFDPRSPSEAKRFFCMITKDVPAFK
ncbi:MAG TPA: hypothetical protein VK540_23195 [Polyangiaceae bacterium]|nr:hypothetical protein [Polyangiaceae bacterium]